MVCGIVSELDFDSCYSEEGGECRRCGSPWNFDGVRRTQGRLNMVFTAHLRDPVLERDREEGHLRREKKQK